MKKKDGFTLVELLVVLSILALLVSLVGPALFKHLSPAKRSVARAQMEMFMGALDSYYLDSGKYPSSSEGLEALRTKPQSVNRWNGPYLKKALPADPWGNAYQYRQPGEHGEYDLYSYGKDGQVGGTGENADITNW